MIPLHAYYTGDTIFNLDHMTDGMLFQCTSFLFDQLSRDMALYGCI